MIAVRRSTFASRPDAHQPAGSGTAPEATAGAPKRSTLPLQAAGGLEAEVAGDGGEGRRQGR